MRTVAWAVLLWAWPLSAALAGDVAITIEPSAAIAKGLGDPDMDPPTLMGGGVFASGSLRFSSGLIAELRSGCLLLGSSADVAGLDSRNTRTLAPLLVGGRLEGVYFGRLRLSAAAHLGATVDHRARTLLGVSRSHTWIRFLWDASLSAAIDVSRTMAVGLQTGFAWVWSQDRRVQASRNGQVYSLGLALRWAL